ncbi:MAG: hypothetical protein HDT23_04305 [Ruminococcus sp.]|nr:hypothetical protein [Ruminococcus sp.]
MLKNGFIIIDRSITQWRWYHDANTFRVFFHLMLTANYEDKDFENITVKRGERVISYSKLAVELSLSERNVRTAIKHLKETGEVTVRAYRKFSVITVNNYDEYQAGDRLLTDNRQASDRQVTLNRQASDNNETKINKDKQSNKDKQYISSSDKSDSACVSEPESAKKTKKSKTPEYPEAYGKIVSYLNQKAGTRYQASNKATQKLINARLNENYTVEDFLTVIDKKCTQWLGTDRQEFLRPSTLFASNHFEEYLNQVIRPRKQIGQNGIEIEQTSGDDTGYDIFNLEFGG